MTQKSSRHRIYFKSEPFRPSRTEITPPHWHSHHVHWPPFANASHKIKCGLEFWIDANKKTRNPIFIFIRIFGNLESAGLLNKISKNNGLINIRTVLNRGRISSNFMRVAHESQNLMLRESWESHETLANSCCKSHLPLLLPLLLQYNIKTDTG